MSASSLPRNLREALNLSYVPRWAIVPMMRQQTVTDHCWRVAMIASHLAARVGTPGVERVSYLAMVHDLEEVRTGDTPSSYKPDPNFSDLTSHYLVVKVADYIEQLTWATMWAHPSRVGGILESTVKPRMKKAVDELERRFGGATRIVDSLVREVMP